MKTIKKLFHIIGVIFFIWMIISYTEILIKNVSEHPIYSSYNIIVSTVNHFDYNERK